MFARGTPGLPALPAALLGAVQLTAFTSDQITGPRSLDDSDQWGIFDAGGNPVIASDNVLAFEYAKDKSVSDYQQEQGAFASYNKVDEPYTVRLRFSTGGSIADRQAFIASIDAAADTLNLFDAATPEKTYLNCNVDHVDYKRDADDVGLLTIDVFLIQIRETGSSMFTNTKTPGGTSAASGGTVEATPPTPNESALYGLTNGLQ